jgi:hypothetical protein
MDDEELLRALGVEVTPIKTGGRTALEERLIAGFEDITRFVEKHGRAPQHGEERDIFERIYAVRLDRLRVLPEAQALLAPLDTLGLLAGAPTTVSPQADSWDDEALLAELGAIASDGDITALRHVRSFDERRAAEEIANRIRCADFATFQPVFDQAESDLKAGLRKTQAFEQNASVDEGDMFILGGQMAYVAHVGRPIKAPNGESDARLRVIYSNGTESDLLRRSLQRALYKDETGRRLAQVNAGPLFGDEKEEGDIASGTIYVLRSLSDHPYVAEHRELIHKIGVTGRRVEERIANAVNDATYLLARVEIVATYTLSNINRKKLEGVFHRIFAPAQLDLTIADRFGNPVHPREWFLVPLPVIDEVVTRIRDGSITGMVYDPTNARLVEVR